jgi:asparagine synthase (glutamine-hydrolysing)
MCGVTGFVSQQIAIDESDSRLTEMLRRIIHRGPDAEGRLVKAELGLYAGMRRLSVIDLASGDQPIWNEDQTIAVLFNGEIYNYRELRSELIKRGHQFRTESDTEVLVHLYEEYGCAMFQKLRRMFAISLFDFRQSRMILVRDHFGQKPLYYHASDGFFAWSSELKSLLVHPEVSREQDPLAFEEYLVWLKVGPGRTHFKNIMKLKPANYLTYDLKIGRVSDPVRYWRYPDCPQVSMSESDAVDRLDELLHDSMKMNLRMDVPMGLLLSGGLDSRTIAYYADQNLNQNVSTYTAGFHADEESELEAAAQTAKDINSSGHTEVMVSENIFRESLESVAWHLDEPVGDPAAFAVMAVCKRE